MSNQTIPLSALSQADADVVRAGAHAGLHFCVLLDFGLSSGLTHRWSVHAVGLSGAISTSVDRHIAEYSPADDVLILKGHDGVEK